MTDPCLLPLALTSLALLVSLCTNVLCCWLRKKEGSRRGTATPLDEQLYRQAYQRESSTRSDRGSHQNEEDSQHQMENPIYGNISTNHREFEEECYEMMTIPRTKDGRKELDVNYASLDLNAKKAQKKTHRYQKGQIQDHGCLRAHLSQPLFQSAVSVASCIEAEALRLGMGASLPPKNSSTMASQSSIYLNSQQIAQETDARHRERGNNTEREMKAWDQPRDWETGAIGEWAGERERGREGERGMDRENDHIVKGGRPTPTTGVEDADHLSSFDCDNGSQV